MARPSSKGIQKAYVLSWFVLVLPVLGGLLGAAQVGIAYMGLIDLVLATGIGTFLGLVPARPLLKVLG